MTLSYQPAAKLFSLLEVTDCDQLRNVNCYEYLFLLLAEVFPNNEAIPTVTSCFSYLADFQKHTVYDPKFPYGDLYTKFLYAFESDIENTEAVWPTDKKARLLSAVFVNQNRALERAAQLKDLTPPASPVNDITPEKVDSAAQKFRTMAPGMLANSMFGGWMLSSTLSYLGATKAFKSMFETSLLSVRNYCYHTLVEGVRPVELRSGTQAQYLEDGSPRVNPLFEAWIRSERHKDSSMACVYINNLGRDIPVAKTYQEAAADMGLRAERGYERNLTLQLHDAERRHPNLIVITLPADKGLFSSTAYLSSEPFIAVRSAALQMFGIALGKGADDIAIKDFYISEAAEVKIYETQEKKSAVLKHLIAISIQKILNLSVDKDADIMLSRAQYQAVYFHFIKYELTHFILNALKPKTFIIACKDGIDRAGVASLYYNLMRSIEVVCPFTSDEFHRALDAAPKYVKGRPMNHHRVILWNVLHHFLSADRIVAPEFLQEWHAANIPVKLQESKMKLAV